MRLWLGSLLHFKYFLVRFLNSQNYIILLRMIITLWKGGYSGILLILHCSASSRLVATRIVRAFWRRRVVNTLVDKRIFRKTVWTSLLSFVGFFFRFYGSFRLRTRLL